MPSAFVAWETQQRTTAGFNPVIFVRGRCEPLHMAGMGSRRAAWGLQHAPWLWCHLWHTLNTSGTWTPRRAPMLQVLAPSAPEPWSSSCCAGLERVPCCISMHIIGASPAQGVCLMLPPAAFPCTSMGRPQHRACASCSHKCSSSRGSPDLGLTHLAMQVGGCALSLCGFVTLWWLSQGVRLTA